MCLRVVKALSNPRPIAATVKKNDFFCILGGGCVECFPSCTKSCSRVCFLVFSFVLKKHALDRARCCSYYIFEIIHIYSQHSTSSFLSVCKSQVNCTLDVSFGKNQRTSDGKNLAKSSAVFSKGSPLVLCYVPLGVVAFALSRPYVI